MTERERKALLAEAKAWRVLAKWCGTGNPDRRIYLCDRLSGRWSDTGYHGCPPLPSRMPRYDMHVRISDHARLSEGGALIVDEYEKDRLGVLGIKNASEGNHPRVIFCLLMALECEEEANA